MLLALDTATRQLALALHDGLTLHTELMWRTPDHHTVELAPQVALMLRRANLAPQNLRGLAVAIGPGSYTGLRIGLSFAKGLAMTHNLPLIGVSTFDILLRGQSLRRKRVWVAVQAGRGRVTVAPYVAVSNTWKLESPPRVTDWKTLVAESTEAAFVCGEVDEAGSQQLAKSKSLSLVPAADSVRRAAHLAEIGWERLRRDQTDDPRTLAPNYGGQPEGMLL